MPDQNASYILGGYVGTNGPGPQAGDGGFQTGRFGRQADLIVSELQGRYYEATKRQNVFCMILQATTSAIAAGNITGASAGANAQFAVVNPVNSGKDMVLLKLTVGVISGTTPVPPITHNVFNGSAVSLAPSGTIYQGYGGLPGPGSSMKGYTSAGGAALTGGGAYTAVRVASFNISAGTFTNLTGTNNTEELAGDLIIPPGVGWAPCWAAAGTTVLGFYGAVWAEVPV